MAKNANPEDVGNRIKEIRTQLGLSMTDFAERIDAKAKSGTVSNWETGKNLPNNKRLKRIAELGDISLDELLYGFDEFVRLQRKVLKDAEEALKDPSLADWEREAYQNVEQAAKRYLDNYYKNKED